MDARGSSEHGGPGGSNLLLGMTACDGLTFTTVLLLLTAVATAACDLPADAQ